MAFAPHMTGFLLIGQVNGCFLLQSKRDPRLVPNTPFSLAINAYHIPMSILTLWQPQQMLNLERLCPYHDATLECVERLFLSIPLGFLRPSNGQSLLFRDNS